VRKLVHHVLHVSARIVATPEGHLMNYVRHLPTTISTWFSICIDRSVATGFKIR